MKDWLMRVTLSDIITILLAIIGALSAVIAYIKAKKSGNTTRQIEVLNKIPELVIKAEAMFGAGNGVAKLQYVLNELRIYALENKINIDTTSLTDKVNAIVNVSNNVNVNGAKAETPHNDVAEDATGAEIEQSTIADIDII